MCDGGCGKFLWCDIPCVATKGFDNCTAFTTIGIIVILVILIGLSIRLFQRTKKIKVRV